MRQGASGQGGSGAAVWAVVALGLPMVAAMAVVGTYVGQEVVMFAGLLAMSVLGFLFVRPIIGLAIMTGTYLAAAYPSALQALGVLTVANLLGLCFVLLLLVRVLEERDLSFALRPPVLILIAIGVLFLFSTLHADAIFPDLQISRATGRTGFKIIDRTARHTDEFTTRLAFLVFLCAFVQTRNHIRVLYLTFMGVLSVAVMSALWNWVGGELRHGFRVAAEVTAGVNANRLAMICCIQVICWWFWMVLKPSVSRGVVMAMAVLGATVVLSGTGSRSGLLGAILTAFVLQAAPRGFRVPRASMVAGGLVFAIVLASVAPSAAVTRMFSFFPESRDAVGASSLEMRESTIETASLIVVDHPLLGIGLGNFREVARQVYADRYFRPPHNSFVWALAEGGLLVMGAYLVLFGVTFRDLSRVATRPDLDRDVATIAMALRAVLVVYLFFSLFADLWLNPMTYVIIGLATTMRRYMDSLAPALATGVRDPADAMGVAA